MPDKPIKREKYICDVKCPSCGQTVIIKKKTTILEPSVPATPAVKEEEYVAEKGGKQVQL